MKPGPTNTGTDPPANGLVPLLLTASQVGELLGLTVDGVKYAHRLRRLPALKVNGKLRWDRRDVVAYVDRLQQEQR